MEPITDSWTGNYCGGIEADKRRKIGAVLSEIVLTSSNILHMIDAFTQNMDMANSADPSVRAKSDHLMENTHIRQLLDGTENGEYLGLDLGGTNFRVVLVRFKDGVAETITHNYVIPEQVLSGPCRGAFDFIADGIKEFFQKEKLTDRKTKIPLVEAVLNDLPFTHYLSFKTIIQEMPVDVVVVMSDTTSTLMAGNYVDKRARIGLILGTGCNAAFVENLENIERWTGDRNDPKHVIINVEWGSTGDKGCMDFVRTRYEKELDRLSNHPGSFTHIQTFHNRRRLLAHDLLQEVMCQKASSVTKGFEKSVGGLYLGELVRLTLVQLAKDGLVFDGNLPSALEKPWSLTAAQITQIESDKGADCSNTIAVLKELGVESPNEDDVAVVRELAEMVCRRGAYVVSAGIAALVKRMRLPEVTVAIDGSVYERHPKFHGYMMEVLDKDEFRCNTRIKLILVKDGSGQGGAFAAASALRQVAAGMRCT